MTTSGGKQEWEPVGINVERFAVPGGWLYRTCSWVEHWSGPGEPRDGYWHWSGPVFVAAPVEVRHG